MDGSARKMSSYDLGSAGVPPAFCESAFAQSDFSEIVFAARAVLGTNPSCRHSRHQDSKSGAAAPCTRSLPLPVLTPLPAPCAFADAIVALCIRSLLLAVL